MIFIVGSGRSGTHWLARSFEDSGANVIGEKDVAFKMSVRAALNLVERPEYTKKLVMRYRSLTCEHVDKCHPNLWVAPDLAAQIPGARFIFMRRGITGIVRSMLDHAGTLRWVLEWDKYGDDCDRRFLGKLKSFDPATMAGRCAARAAMHLRRQDELRCLQSFRFDYDDAVKDPHRVESEIREWSGVGSFRLQEAHTTAHRELSEEELQDVTAVLRHMKLEHLPL